MPALFTARTFGVIKVNEDGAEFVWYMPKTEAFHFLAQFFVLYPVVNMFKGGARFRDNAFLFRAEWYSNAGAEVVVFTMTEFHSDIFIWLVFWDAFEGVVSDKN